MYVFINSVTQFRIFFKKLIKKVIYVILKKRNNHTENLYGILKRKKFMELILSYYLINAFGSDNKKNKIV